MACSYKLGEGVSENYTVYMSMYEHINIPCLTDY